MSKQMEEFKARVAEHIKKNPQMVSGIDLKTAKISTPTPKKEDIVESVAEDIIEDIMEDGEEDAT